MVKKILFEKRTFFKKPVMFKKAVNIRKKLKFKGKKIRLQHLRGITSNIQNQINSLSSNNTILTADTITDGIASLTGGTLFPNAIRPSVT